MTLKTRLIFCIFMIIDISIHSNARDAEVRSNEICETSLTSVFCEGLSGKFIPSDCSVHVKVMYITESNLSFLSEDDFAALENLDTIYIDSCTIASGNNIFSPVKSLQTLEIINSNASEEVFNLFGSAKHLVKLSLERNKITRITKGVFNGLTYLEEADLRHNEASDVMNSSTPETYLPPLRNAGNLDKPSLENNNLSRVKRQAFDSWSHLEEINLSHNEISTIDADAFAGLSALRKLDLSYNMLSSVFEHSIQKGVFDNLPRLEALDLSHNEIFTIEADAFRGLSALRRLDLTENRLGEDFDLSSLSLPASCVAQSLVANCSGAATDDRPPDEGQRSAQDGPRRPPWRYRSQGARTHGGVCFGGVLGATLLAMLSGYR